MIKKYLMLLLLIQVIFASVSSGQAVGIGTSSVSGYPLSTLDIGQTFGITLAQNTGTAQTVVQIENSSVLYTAFVSGNITITLPTPSASYLRRIYIVGQATSGNSKTNLTISPSYYNLNHVLVSSVLVGKSIMVICDGANWLQIL